MLAAAKAGSFDWGVPVLLLGLKTQRFLATGSHPSAQGETDQNIWV